MAETKKKTRTVKKRKYVVQTEAELMTEEGDAAMTVWIDVYGQPEHKDTGAGQAWVRANITKFKGKKCRVISVGDTFTVKEKTVTELVME